MTGEHLGICEVAVIPRHGMYQNHTTVPFKIQSSTIHLRIYYRRGNQYGSYYNLKLVLL